MKRIISFLCTLQNFSIIWKQPLNPILGETHSSYLDDDTQIFMEQVSHHPPISYFYVKNDLFISHGYFEAKPRLRLPNVSVEVDGRMHIQFLNSGNRYVVTQPNLRIKGVMTGGRKFIIEGDAFIYGLERSKTDGDMGQVKFDKANFKDERLFTHIHFGGGKPSGLLGRRTGSYDWFEGDTFKFDNPITLSKMDLFFLGNKEEREGTSMSKVLSKAWSKKVFKKDNAVQKIKGFWTNKVKINEEE